MYDYNYIKILNIKNSDLFSITIFLVLFWSSNFVPIHNSQSDPSSEFISLTLRIIEIKRVLNQTVFNLFSLMAIFLIKPIVDIMFTER